jgi:enoyl-CoA hydratase/carnithine racemase
MNEVVYEHRGAAAWIRLNRPSALNSLNGPMVGALREAIEQARIDDSVRALVVTGNGRAFCAGGDLKAVRELADTDPRGNQGFLLDVGGVLNSLESFPKPVIAAVNGLAMAGGLEIVLSCDLVVAVDTAPIGDAHSNYGLIPGGGASIRLPRRVGRSMASFLLFTGKALPAAQLVDCGLVNMAVPGDQLTATVDGLVASIAAKSPLGLARIKQLIMDGSDQPLPTGLRLELLASEAHAKSHDMAEGLAAFEEKRTPVFKGR